MLAWRWFEIIDFPKFSLEIPVDSFLRVAEIVSSIIVLALDLEKTTHINVGLLFALVVIVLIVVDAYWLVVSAISNDDAVKFGQVDILGLVHA